MRKHVRSVFGAAAALVVISAAAPAAAAPEFVNRRITMPRGNFALDLGLGVGFRDRAVPDESIRGTGVNLEAALAVRWNLELGFRTGIRFADYGGATGAAEYGRVWATETYGVNGDQFANPELRLTWEVISAGVAELGLEWRAYFPTENGSHFGVMFGMPLRLHLGHVVRIDTGIYVPVFVGGGYGGNPDVLVSLPLHLWFQVTHRVWLGPLTGVRLVHDHDQQVPLGFGVGIALARVVDFKSWFYLPDVHHDAAAHGFGVGFGLQLRIE